MVKKIIEEQITFWKDNITVTIQKPKKTHTAIGVEIEFSNTMGNRVHKRIFHDDARDLMDCLHAALEAIDEVA